MMRKMRFPSAPAMGWIGSAGLLAAGIASGNAALLVAGLGVAGISLAGAAVRVWLS